MKNVFFICIMLMCSFAALAGDDAPNPCSDIAATADNLNLSAGQVKVLASNCQNTQQTAVEILSKAEVIDTAGQWGVIAKDFAQAIGIAAKELGIAVNDFLDSPAGYLMALILLVKYAGALLIGIPYTLFSGWCLYKVLYNFRIEKITYEYRKALWGLFEYRKVSEVTLRDELPEHVAFYGVIAMIFTTVSNLAVWIDVV